MKLRTLVNNLRYITKFDIEQLLYESEENYIKRPKILPPDQTVELLINSNNSICRFGDGEITLIAGNDIPFQKASKELSEKLLEILQSNQKGFLIGINYEYYYSFLSNFYPHGKNFYRSWLPKNRKRFSAFLNWEKKYVSAGFNQLYVTYMKYDFKTHFEKLRSIWQDKDITIICGEGITKGHEYDVFDNVNSINYIHGPNTNSFEDYDHLFEKAKKINIDHIIITMLGPGGKVLAYDLHKLGYRSLDLGHLAKDYDWYMKKISITTENIFRFYAPD